MLHHSLNTSHLNEIHNIFEPKRSRKRTLNNTYTRPTALSSTNKSQIANTDFSLVNDKKSVISEKRKLQNEGKLKLHNFLSNITNFENNLKLHRRYMTDMIQLQKTVKNDIYERYKSINQPKNVFKVKNVKITTKNLSLTSPYIDTAEFKPEKRFRLADKTEVKPLKNYYSEYIKKMTKLKISNDQKEQRESMKEQMVMNMNRVSLSSSKTSILHRIMKLKTSVGENSRNKSKVQVVLFSNMLFNFIKKNKIDEVKKILIKNTELVNRVNKNGKTALNKAIKYRFVDMMQVLIDLGAEVNNPDNFDVKPLELACKINNLDAAKVS